MCRFNNDCTGSESDITSFVRKNVETMAGTYDFEVIKCSVCGSSSSKPIIPEPKVKKKRRVSDEK